MTCSLTCFLRILAVFAESELWKTHKHNYTNPTIIWNQLYRSGCLAFVVMYFWPDYLLQKVVVCKRHREKRNKTTPCITKACCYDPPRYPCQFTSVFLKHSDKQSMLENGCLTSHQNTNYPNVLVPDNGQQRNIDRHNRQAIQTGTSKGDSSPLQPSAYQQFSNWARGSIQTPVFTSHWITNQTSNWLILFLFSDCNTCGCRIHNSFMHYRKKIFRFLCWICYCMISPGLSSSGARKTICCSLLAFPLSNRFYSWSITSVK